MIEASLFLLLGGIVLFILSLFFLGSTCSEQPLFEKIIFIGSIIIAIVGLILTGYDALVIFGIL